MILLKSIIKMCLQLSQFLPLALNPFIVPSYNCFPIDLKFDLYTIRPLQCTVLFCTDHSILNSKVVIPWTFENAVFHTPSSVTDEPTTADFDCSSSHSYF